MNKNKKGISPLIATVLIIGFTIVIAALVITWGTNLFKKTQESTGQTADLNLACTEVLGSLTLTPRIVDNDTMSITVDNGARRGINGFVVRIYNTSLTSADTIDTATVVAGTITPEDYVIAASGLKTYTVNYNNTLVTTPGKIGFSPKVEIGGSAQKCTGEATKELL